ncbi:nucleotidyltransferase domain-containing protein [Clostridium saccharobutylicum]|uniref:Nucleotidyltransferase family protein n=1 Tax=Clostridium saccharobutylicum DSM 13864 TaxID=1345695 RepID=U5MNP9_CLOSA|nr:nucleotidyltransferase domain-containing protein [Clostridium saccharobutylicum]AGX42148.1 nucleotidyltransferase family protein [Clostridium saccharobutylicum DSM 13864]AQR89428.1 nucleotidyltransferase domain protein [Clostridium saccharobutylicum]AQR99330.1 nucleotidyltransferase domain protein [Clostridium saccharobutylicum]AQS09061.1 nucleotidyltransferase domain protein [Clostridium saccharobutylicum]AQS13316.1 nucleotidyltransferase domain protein [Clostridium saccharobutylicum]
MLKSILNYQKASEKLISILKTNKRVLAIFVYGSIVSGDLWEESDIDLFVVYKDQFEEIRDVYSEMLDIPVHMKILNKNRFMELYESDGKKGFVRNLLISSKIIFSRDDEIESIFNKAKYSSDKYKERWNLVYLGKLIKDIGVTKKYLQNDSLFTSYEVLIRALDSFSKLYLNLNGYTVSKDAVKMVMNLNNEFDIMIENLFYNERLKENIKNTVQYVETFLDDNINLAGKFLLDYLYKKNTFLSSYEIQNDELFKEFDIKIEDILKELYKKKLVVKDSRKLDLPSKEKLINESVYSYKIYN